jgi:hypothetical protein
MTGPSLRRRDRPGRHANPGGGAARVQVRNKDDHIPMEGSG